ncbi:MAG TPA: hypothetical protein VEB19_15100 [Gemmatimonadaceae bacterium]|nr:hypothetical protein [Gemmatimonadaceae bacterium]
MKLPVVLSLALALGTPGMAEAQKRDKPEIPASSRPPAGMCRIWLDDVPASRQPAPTDCASAVRNRPAKGRVIFGDDYVTKKSGPATKRPSDTATKTRSPIIKGFAPTKGKSKKP